MDEMIRRRAYQPPSRRPELTPQLRQQTPEQFRRSMAAPVKAPTPAQAAERQQAWAIYAQCLPLYRQMLASPLARLDHKMAVDAGGFPFPEVLQRELPLPPKEDRQPAQNEVQQAQAAGNNSRSALAVQNVMDQMVADSGVGDLRGVYRELTGSISEIVSKMRKLSEEPDRLAAQGSILRLAQHIDHVCGLGADMRPYLSGMPMSGVVFGILDRVKAFSGRVVSVLQAKERLGHMRAQRRAAKEDLHSSLIRDREEARAGGGKVRGAAQYLMEEQGRGGMFSGDRDMKLRMKREFSPDRNGWATRMDEQLIRLCEVQKQSLASGSIQGEIARRVEAELSRAEDHDLTRELAEMNKKRESSGFWELLIKDAASIAAGLVSLDPAGGPLLGGAINAIIQGGSHVKEDLASARQWYRNKGLYGADLNKSDQMKGPAAARPGPRDVSAALCAVPHGRGLWPG